MSQAGSAGERGVGAGRAGPTLAQLGHRRASWGQREIAILYRGAAAGESLPGPAGRGSAGAPGHIPPRHGTLLTTCPALVARTGTRQARGTICLKLSCSVGVGGPFRPVTEPFWGQTKGTSSQQQSVPVCKCVQA